MALLPKKQRDQAMVLVCIVAAALGGLYYMYVWSPKRTELAALSVRVDSLELANTRARTEIAKGTADQLQAEAEQYGRDLEIMRTLVPTGNELPGLLEQVSTSARRAGLDLSAVEPQPVEEGEQFDTYKYKIAVRRSICRWRPPPTPPCRRSSCARWARRRSTRNSRSRLT